MNIYDKSHELAAALKNSSEYVDVITAQKVLNTDPQAKAMVQEFITKQMELEYDKMAKKPEDKAKMEKLQQLSQFIAGNSKAVQYLNAYMKFQRMVGDIYKILGDSIAEGMDLFDKK